MSLIPGLWLNCCCRGKVLSENNEIRVQRFSTVKVFYCIR